MSEVSEDGVRHKSLSLPIAPEKSAKKDPRGFPRGLIVS
jgi:hypothetical protein